MRILDFCEEAVEDRNVSTEDSENSSIYENIDFENGFSMTEDDKVFILSEFKDHINFLKENGEFDDAEEYRTYYNEIKKHGVIENKDIIQRYAFQLSEAVMHEIYNYYRGNGTIIRFIEKSLLGKKLSG